MTADELRRLANGCIALACYPGNLEQVKANINRMPNVMHKADALEALRLVDRDVPDERAINQQRRDFFRG
jgi:hypothetical protein